MAAIGITCTCLVRPGNLHIKLTQYYVIIMTVFNCLILYAHVLKVVIKQRPEYIATSLRKSWGAKKCIAQAALLLFNSTSFPKSPFKQVMSAYDQSKKDSIIWGINNEPVAKYCTFGDAVVEETGISKVFFFFFVCFVLQKLKRVCIVFTAYLWGGVSVG